MISYTIDGVDLKTYGIQRSSSYRTPVKVTTKNLTLPGRHGAVNTGSLPVFEEPTLTFQFLMLENNTPLETAQSNLALLLSRPGLTVTRIADGVSASATGRLTSLTSANYEPGVALTLTAMLTIPDVFWKAAPALYLGQTLPATHTITTLSDSTAPITDAIIRVTGPCTAIQITDAVSGTGLTWAGSLAAGQYLYLDASKLTARRSSTSNDSVNAGVWTNNSGTDVTSGIDYPPTGILQAWPNANGIVTLDVTGSGFTSESKIAIRAAKTYL